MIQAKTVINVQRKKDQGHGQILQIAKKKTSHGGKRKKNVQTLPPVHLKDQKENVMKTTENPKYLRYYMVIKVC